MACTATVAYLHVMDSEQLRACATASAPGVTNIRAALHPAPDVFAPAGVAAWLECSEAGATLFRGVASATVAGLAAAVCGSAPLACGAPSCGVDVEAKLQHHVRHSDCTAPIVKSGCVSCVWLACAMNNGYEANVDSVWRTLCCRLRV